MNVEARMDKSSIPHAPTYQPVAPTASPGFSPPHFVAHESYPPPPSTPDAKLEERRGLKDRLGPTAIVTLALGTAVEFGLIAFLVYFWTGIGSEPDGEQASSFWRYLVLNSYATRTVTICALVLRTAVDLQAVVCTGLAAALLIEARAVFFADVATFSILRAVNGGPSSITKELFWTPSKFLRSVPAFTSLVLLLTCVAIQFTSTLLLSDFRPASVVANPVTGFTPVLQTLPDLVFPFQAFDSVGIWRQALSSFPAFAEARSGDPIVDAAVSDTGLIKRAFLPIAAQQRQSIRQYEGAAVTHESRVACVRPTLSGSISGLLRVPRAPRLPPEANLVTAQINGTLSWPSQSGRSGLEGLACGTEKTCPPVPITCAVPYSMPVTSFISILDQRPTTICLFQQPDEYLGPHLNDSRLLLVFNTLSTGEEWASVGNATNGTVSLPGPIDAGEWAEFHIGTGVTLRATLCLANSSVDIENIAANSVLDPGEQTMAYRADNKTWNTQQIAKMVDASGKTSAADRGILALVEATKTSEQELDTMYRAAGVNYRPDDGTALDIAAQFLSLLNRAVTNSLGLTDTNSLGNASIYMCSQCSNISGTWFDPHPYTVLLFHAVLDAKGHASEAIQATLFWLTQAQYYNALPGFDFGADSHLMFSQSVSIPRVYSGLGAVIMLTLLNMACVAVFVTLFIRRTRYSMYGNAWHVVAQLVAPDTRHLLDRATQSTDDEVAASLGDVGLGKTNAGVYRAESGKVVVARRGALGRYGHYSHIG